MTAQNHWIPQFLLRRWSDDGTYLWVYRLLVPRADYPIWKRKPVSSVAVWPHLYATTSGGVTPDHFETWLKDEFEDPAVPALQRVWSGESLTREDGVLLGRFAASLDVRTPAAYQAMRRRVEERDVKVLENSLQGALDRAVAGHRRGSIRPPRAHQLPLVLRKGLDQSGRMAVQAEVEIGRQWWLFEMQQLLTHTVRRLERHHWSIATPHGAHRWLLPDHPVIRLNWTGYHAYDFGGGWGSKGSEILVPLSPVHMLYTRIGHRMPPSINLDRERTLLLQKLLAERASRALFHEQQLSTIRALRERSVDRQRFQDEELGRHQWHHLQGGGASPSAT